MGAKHKARKHEAHRSGGLPVAGASEFSRRDAEAQSRRDVETGEAAKGIEGCREVSGGAERAPAPSDTSRHLPTPPDTSRLSSIVRRLSSLLRGRAAPPPRSRLRRLLPDIIWTAIALVVIGLGVAVWRKPPLMTSSFPYVSYTHGGQTFTDAKLYRPLAVPTRFYVGLPEKIASRYQWFTIDGRREVVALADGPPQDMFLWWPAVRRDAPLGLDLEFRKLDGPASEWRVFFFPDAIVFSNNVLAVRLDTKNPAQTHE